MVLDFGLIGGQDKLGQTADYRTAGSHQAENLNFEFITDADVWEEILTVTEGKTYYVSAMYFALNITTTFRRMEIGVGASAAEVVVLAVQPTRENPAIMTLPTPIKFSSGTRISLRTVNSAEDGFVTLVGWEE